MKTNKMCPKYQEVGGSSLQTSRIEDETINEELSNLATEDIIKVEGTKITLGKALLEAYVSIYGFIFPSGLSCFCPISCHLFTLSS